MLTRSDPTQRRPVNAFKDYIMARFEEKGETPRSFAHNSDYTRQAVEMMVHGYTASPRIRRDVALYLGFKGWGEMIRDFYAGEGVLDAIDG